MGCCWSSCTTDHQEVCGLDASVPSHSITAIPLHSTTLNPQHDTKISQTDAKKKKKFGQRIEPKTENRTRNKLNGPLSPYYDKLPSGAKSHTVVSVYDGDTFTLHNKKQRVRFLGIDCPELKNPTQAFSQEAKDYTKRRCEQKNIWLVFPTGQELEDRFGRLLAMVWVQHGDGTFECVNEGLVKEGLAAVYTPSNSQKLHNINKLIAMQKEARQAKRGLWSRFREYIVVKTPYGCAFHHSNKKCVHLKRSNFDNLVEMKASEALNGGHHACRTCLADDQNVMSTEAALVSVY